MADKKRFRLGWMFIAILVAGLIGLVVFFWMPPPVLITDKNKSISAYGPIVIEFPASIEPELVENQLSFTPHLNGFWVWEGNKGYFFPDKPLEIGLQYEIQLNPGVMSSRSAFLWPGWTKTIEAREPLMVYLGNPIEKPEIWLLDPEDGTPRQITETQGNVNDYSVSRDGEQVAFSVKNAEGGSDLYVWERATELILEVLKCGPTRCTEPVLSITGHLIAYSRSVVDAETGGVRPEIWTVNIASGHTGPVFTEPEVNGITPSFSPDGTYLAFYDLTNRVIRLVDMQSGVSRLLPTRVEAVGVWSPAGTEMIFTDLGPETLIPETRLYQQNLESVMDEPIEIIAVGGFEISSLAWSPNGKRLVAGLRLLSGPPSRQLWIYSLETNDALEEIAQQGFENDAAPAWSPDSQSILFQRYLPGSSSNQPDVMLWTEISKVPVVLVENAALPAWLP